ncbi:IS3 family transposase [Myxococcus xanthus]|uniref:IS3 family transposase n=1 Tax=Myxococcus xanthus TaxID=34 RepID=UPI0021F0DF32|nr:IS3 family transposase [Myxococcus xanthus]
MKAVAEALGVARSNLVLRVQSTPTDAPARRGPYFKRTDEALLARIRVVTEERASYGYRRVTPLLNRQLASEGQPRVNPKRVYRMMRAAGLLLARHTGKPTRTHEGKVAPLKSNLRWCSDSFEIRCWNGERVQVAFSLDCCDREAMRFVATTESLTGELVRDLMAETLEARFGAGCRRTPHPIEWLTDNGPPYTALETREFGASLGLLIRTTQAYSPESNGMAESFVKSLKRDYVHLARLDSAEVVLQQLPAWFADYNTIHPHKALKMRSPREFRLANSPH